MKLYRLTAKQYLPIGLEEAWSFLSDPRNLQKITPEPMGFEILSGAEQPMYAGQIIQYRVSPIRGVRTRWVSEITHYQEKRYFVDEQRFGPYSLWHHKHFLYEDPAGVMMKDIVDYKLPLGPLGSLAQALFVKKQLTTIFRYRVQALETTYGTIPGRTPELTISAI